MLNELYDYLRERWRIPPSLLVIFLVLVLLYDFGGAFSALWDMLVNVLAALVGGGDHEVVASVIWRTLPLALAAAGVTFAVCNRWLPLDSSHSYVFAGLIVLAGAIVGNACHETFASKSQLLAIDDPQDESLIVHSTPKPIGLTIDSSILGDSPNGLRSSISRDQIAAMPAESFSWSQLASLRWLAKPNLEKAPQSVQPVKLLPDAPGILGAVTAAINQLLGYLLAYQPRLFLASILAGSFAGWRLQRRVAVAQAMVSGDTRELTNRETKRLAA